MPKKQKSGLYRSKVTIGADPSGKPVYKYISGRTRRELDEARQAVIARYIDKTALDDDMLFGVLCGKWFDAYKKPFLRPASIGMYRSIINTHILPVFAERRLRSISALDLQSFLNSHAGMLPKSMIVAMRGVLHGVFAYAYSERMIASDPSAALRMPPAAPAKEKHALTADERARIVACIAHNPDALPLALLYYTGMRQGEMRGLQWGDVDFTANLIHIQRDVDDTSHRALDSLKTPAANRYVPICSALRAILLPLRGLPSVFVVQSSRPGCPVSATWLYTLWARLMVECGLASLTPAARKLSEDERAAIPLRSRYQCTITPHALRHNFITMCWEAGIDPLIVQRIVGHSSYTVTADVYTHLSASSLDSVSSSLDKALSTVTDMFSASSDT